MGLEPSDDTGGLTDSTSHQDTLVFSVAEAAVGATLRLLAFRPSGQAPTEQDLGEVQAAAVLDTTSFALALPSPPSDPLYAETVIGSVLHVAWYLPVLHQDLDGDAAWSAGEDFVGVGRSLPAWVEGEIPEELAAQGVVEGWNAFVLGEDDLPAAVEDPLTVPLPANLVPVGTVTLGGTLASVAPEGLHLVAQPLGGLDVAAALFDLPLTDPWEIAVEGEPPADHVLALESWRYAHEQLLAELPEGSGGEEPWYALACVDDLQASLEWLVPLDLVTALGLLRDGFTAGWNAVGEPSDGGLPVALDEVQRRSITVDPDVECLTAGS